MREGSVQLWSLYIAAELKCSERSNKNVGQVMSQMVHQMKPSFSPFCCKLFYLFFPLYPPSKNTCHHPTFIRVPFSQYLLVSNFLGSCTSFTQSRFPYPSHRSTSRFSCPHTLNSPSSPVQLPPLALVFHHVILAHQMGISAVTDQKLHMCSWPDYCCQTLDRAEHDYIFKLVTEIASA